MAKRVDTVSSGVDRSVTKGQKAAGSATDTKGGAHFDSASGMAASALAGVAGETLDSILEKAGHLSPLDALRYLTPLMSVLGTLHANRQAHGNLSLDLLRVTQDEDGALRLQILKTRKSLPTMRDANPKASLSGRMILYSSPEQIQGATPSEFDDMYAVGFIAYTLLVGEPYWADEVDRLGFMAFCKTIMGGLPEAPSVRAMRRKAIRLPQDFDAWFVLITDRKHSDRFPDITDASIALTSVLSNPDIRELSRSVQFNFNPNILDMPAVPPPAPTHETENLRFTALLTIVASLFIALAFVLLLRWSNAHEPSARTPSPSPMPATLASAAPTTAPSAAIAAPKQNPR